MFYFTMKPGGPGTVLAQATTNDDGTYEAAVPLGIPELIIWARQIKNEQGKWHYPHPQEHALTKRTSSGFHTLNAIKEDIHGVDWILKEAN